MIRFARALDFENRFHWRKGARRRNVDKEERVERAPRHRNLNALNILMFFVNCMKIFTHTLP